MLQARITLLYLFDVADAIAMDRLGGVLLVIELILFFLGIMK